MAPSLKGRGAGGVARAVSVIRTRCAPVAAEAKRGSPRDQGETGRADRLPIKSERAWNDLGQAADHPIGWRKRGQLATQSPPSLTSAAGLRGLRFKGMSDHEGDEPVIDKKLGRELLRQFKRNARYNAERVKYDPWQHERRRVAAEVERTGNESLWADFERRFLAAQALLCPPETHARW
jgi:hypothetical protein